MVELFCIVPIISLIELAIFSSSGSLDKNIKKSVTLKDELARIVLFIKSASKMYSGESSDILPFIAK